MNRCLIGLLALALALAGFPAEAAPTTLYVAPNGRDVWTGQLAEPNAAGTDGPFATLERARDAIRALKKAGPLPAGGVSVELRGGVYELAQPLALTAQDAGTAEAPIEYRARPGEAVRVLGGRRLGGWQPVTDAAVLAKLDPSARGKVLQTDLKAQGVKDYGKMGGGFGLSGGPGLELFFRDQPMTVSRYPNEGFIRITGVQGLSPVDVRGTKGAKEGMLTYDDDRPARWVAEKDPWVLGYWFWDWAEGRQPIARIDPAKHYLELKPPWHSYGYRKGQWFYGYNLLCEIDSPGEWYLDRETGLLYFWPPAAPAEGEAMVTVLANLATLNGASYVSFRGLTLEGCRSDGITMTNCTGNRVAGCTIRNLGSWAVQVNGGGGVQVIGCDIYATGDGGVSLSGGDRKTLVGAGHVAEDNHIHHYSRWNRMYRPAVMIGGVGQRVAHNLIDNAPHMAIGFGGNDHVIEYNEIHSVCYESNDAGAMYAGRNWSMRGTVIRYNYLHHINGFEGRGCVGVYLDDQFSGTTILGNLFVNVTRAAMIGGGRDCTIENNVFVDCVPAAHVDARGLGWAAGGFGGMKGSLLQTPYQQPPWSERYPKLVGILDDEPMAPKGNTIARNICVGGRWGDFEGKAKPLVTFTDNLLDQDPLFVDAAKRDFRLKADSPALKLGFKPLPYAEMGLYQSGLRASWPVEHPVRPMVKPPGAKPRAQRTGPAPACPVARVAAPITVDGTLNAAEWGGLGPDRAMVLAQDPMGGKVAPRSLAWLAYDDQALYVAFDNQVDAAKPLRLGGVWGQDDAVEVAVRRTGVKDSPILILRGYPKGSFESSAEAEAPAAAVKRAAGGVQYQARVVGPDRWTAEWRIPWASLGLDPAKDKRIAMNLSVRKTAGDQWVLWQGTGGRTWEVDHAGVVDLR